MRDWVDELECLVSAEKPAVIVTVAGIRGSAPREVGAKMLVTEHESIGTIGGGQLEHECTRLAVGMLGSGPSASMRKFSLGSSMGQCCGGVVDVLFESADADAKTWISQLTELRAKQEPAIIATRICSNPAKFVVAAGANRAFAGLPEEVQTRARVLVADHLPAERSGEYFLEPVVETNFHLAVFGAGHVGAALVRALAALECNIRWVDSRPQIFDQVPGGVKNVVAREPAMEVGAMPPASFYLVMTHSHALDFEICDRILRRRDAAYCGLIGSLSKRRRFEKRFRQQGMSDASLDSLVCPIGVNGISSKKPAELALAVAAELLQVREQVASMGMNEPAGIVQPLRR